MSDQGRLDEEGFTGYRCPQCRKLMPIVAVKMIDTGYYEPGVINDVSSLFRVLHACPEHPSATKFGVRINLKEPAGK